MQFTLELQKNETTRATNSALHLEGELGILEIDTRINSVLTNVFQNNL